MFSAVLSLNHSGVLKIESQNGKPIILYSSPQPTHNINNTLATLLDTGNFVLQQLHPNGTKSVLWQSFDYPVDILLPTMKLGVNRKTGHNWSLVSQLTDSILTPGAFSLEWEPKARELIIKKHGRVCWKSGKLRNNGLFDNIPEDIQSMYQYTIVSNCHEDSFTFKFETQNNEESPGWLLSPIGRLASTKGDAIAKADTCYGYNSDGGCQRWVGIPSCREPGDGFQEKLGSSNGSIVTNIDDMSYTYSDCKDICWSNCNCTGFKQFYDDNQTGCVLYLWNSTKDVDVEDENNNIRFHMLVKDVKAAPKHVKDVKGAPKHDPEADPNSTIYNTCGFPLQDFKPTLDFSLDGINGGSGFASLHGTVQETSGRVLFPFEDLKQVSNSNTNPTMNQNTKEYHRGYSTGFWTGMLGEDHGQKRWLWISAVIAAAVIAAALLVTCPAIFCLAWKKRKYGFEGNKSKKMESEMLDLAASNESSGIKDLEDDLKGHDIKVLNYTSVLEATNGFSPENKLGQGGYGPVYKGILPTGQEVAVKRLSKTSGQGIMEFKNELTLICQLQHKNLVQLLGCCIHEEERILIYEYMPNKSLDFYLFDCTRRKFLDWNKRFNIIEGISQGLLYLHKYSRLKIIHRDLKASNILLDENMSPKISDFGMARMFTQQESTVNTNRIVGTYGYMSPEYAMEGVCSTKSDVYSFGVLLLEIVSGRRNNSFYCEDTPVTLIGYAWELWKEGEWLQLMDPSLNDTFIPNEVQRCINVGLLCVAHYANYRPTMSDVISMLTNKNALVTVPRRPAFYVGREILEETTTSKVSETYFSKEISTSSEVE